MTKVYALQRGHDGRLVRDVGEVFDIDLKDKRFEGSTWFAPVDAPEVAKARQEKAKKPDPKARPPGAGPLPGSAAEDDPAPGQPQPTGDMV